MAARLRSNLLALAVLALLAERPMHPYEMATTMRERRKEESIKLNYGSLYSTVQSLDKRGLISVKSTTRDGKRPERTIYAITEAGKLELDDWMSELIATPAREYTSFEAGLSLLPVLEPAEAVRRLEERVAKLGEWLLMAAAVHELAAKQGLPRLLVIESEYTVMQKTAELEWTKSLIEEIKDGTLQGIADWHEWHKPENSQRER